MLSGRAVKPGDIVRTMNGLTVEINNTDAEGRLVLADCIAHAIAEGAERLVDLATLTGAIVVALGSTYAGLLEQRRRVVRAGRGGRRSAPASSSGGCRCTREYAEAVKGDFRRPQQRAGAAARPARSRPPSSSHRFAGETPWAHLDIAGTAWDLGRAYAEKGGSGFGVRLLVELASNSG